MQSPRSPRPPIQPRSPSPAPETQQLSTYIIQQHAPSTITTPSTLIQPLPLQAGKSKTITYENGDKYDGEINRQGQPEGNGLYYYMTQRHEYHGMFMGGRPHGRGQLFKIIPNQNNSGRETLFLVYEGEWQNGMKNGRGKYYYNSNNHYYEGNWLNDQRHGNDGTYVSPVGRYTGKWRNGLMQGRGQFHNPKTGTTYSGNFQNNQFLTGTITYNNGDQYTGSVKNGLRNDNQGRYLYRNLSTQSQQKQVKYIGGWRNDIKHDESGLASLTYQNGDTIRGVYRDGKFVDSAECVYQWADGAVFKGWYERGVGGEVLKGVVKQPDGREYEV